MNEFENDESKIRHAIERIPFLQPVFVISQEEGHPLVTVELKEEYLIENMISSMMEEASRALTEAMGTTTHVNLALPGTLKM